MNMQDVTDLAISEGDVRTIHDSSNNLLWGKLSYDTKYAGDTFQQTYSGKNLVNPDNIVTGVNHGVTLSYDPTTQTITMDGTCSANNTAFSFINGNNTLALDGTYTLSFEYVSGTIESATTSTGVQIAASDWTDKYMLQLANISGQQTKTVNYTVGQASIRVDNGVKLTNYKFRLQLEAGSSATSWERFVGRTASPNPPYPQTVQTVTGEQTVTVGDGMNSESFTVNLGSIELCKIGDYQDYIYKSGDDWYVHKACGKVIWNGAEAWQYDSATTRAVTTNPTNIKTYYTGDLCTHLVPGDSSSATQNNVFNVGGSSTFVKATSVLTSANAWKTWLASNNVSLYYALATPTDTKITDNTLIGQLEAVHEWLTRYGYNSTVSGTLPLIIEQTNLS